MVKQSNRVPHDWVDVAIVRGVVLSGGLQLPGNTLHVATYEKWTPQWRRQEFVKVSRRSDWFSKLICGQSRVQEGGTFARGSDFIHTVRNLVKEAAEKGSGGYDISGISPATDDDNTCLGMDLDEQDPLAGHEL